MLKNFSAFSLGHLTDGVWISVPERKVACFNEAKVRKDSCSACLLPVISEPIVCPDLRKETVAFKIRLLLPQLQFCA